MLARKSALIVLNNALGAALGLVASYFMGHYLGKAAMGMWAFALALVGLASFVGDFGLSYAHQKRVSEHNADLATLVGTFARLRVLSIGLMVAVVVVLLGVWVVVLGKSFTDSTTVPVLLLALAYSALMLWLTLPKSTFVGLGRIASAELPVLVEHVVRVPAVVLVAMYFASLGGKRGPLASRVGPFFDAFPDLARSPEVAGMLLAAAHVAGMLAAVIAGWLLFVRARVPLGPGSAEIRRDYVRMAFPIALFHGVGVLSTQLDRVMVGYFWNDAEVGTYFAAQRIVLLVLALPSAVFVTLFPQVSYHWSKGEVDATRELMVRAERYMSMALFLVVTLMLVFPEQALNVIFGASFVNAAPTLRALAFFVLFGSLARPYHALVTGAGRPKLLFRSGALAAVVNVGLNIVLIPTSLLGVPLAGLRSFGAAIATAVATLTALIYFRVAAQRILPLPYVMPFHLKHVTAAAVAWAVIFVPDMLVPGDLYAAVDNFYPLLWLVAGNLVVALVYVLVLVLLGEFGRRELELARELMHPRAMARDVAHDLRSEAKPRR